MAATGRSLLGRGLQQAIERSGWLPGYRQQIRLSGSWQGVNELVDINPAPTMNTSLAFAGNDRRL